MRSAFRIAQETARKLEFTPAMRLYSSSRPCGSSATEKVILTASRVVSRRIWHSHLLKNPKQKNTPSNTSSSSANKDDKPWPNSVIYAGYVAAVTLIPYVSLWLISSSPALREFLFRRDDSEIMNRIRQHFGEIDPDSVSYVDAVVHEPRVPLEKRLPLEESAVVRATQAEIQKLQATEIVTVVGRVDEASATVVDKVTLKLPGSTRANQETLYNRLMAATSNSPSLVVQQQQQAGSTTIPSIAVYFPRSTNDDDSSLDSETGADRSTSTTLFSIDVPLLGEPLSKETDPLIKKVHIYSSWQYQDPELTVTAKGKRQHQGSTNESSELSSTTRQQQRQPTYSVDELEKSRLKYEIAQLEAELKTGASNRPIDDILEELNRNKAQLRNLTWRRWVPW